mgnify:CR=1 FL=1|tara:strand:+ start:471 stop:716 length:246 start_codon:yes stop_codon:yes gene_type:complete
MNTDIDPVSSIISEMDIRTAYKMLFIYNAVQKGWTVKKLKDTRFEFSHNKDEIKKDFYLDDFLKDFVKSNLDINMLHTDNE